MRPEILNELENLLNRAKISEAVVLLKDWLQSAKVGDPEQLLAACDGPLQKRLAILFRDVLSRYPTTILGFPVLLEAERDSAVSLARAKAVLPAPADNTRWPCADLLFLGWASAETQLPLNIPYRQPCPFEIEWDTPTGVVALFRTTPHVFDLDSLVLPDQWWFDLFSGFQGKLRVSARVMLPYPDGLEAARALQAAARDQMIQPSNNFLSDGVWTWACNEGLAFNGKRGRGTAATYGHTNDSL